MVVFSPPFPKETAILPDSHSPFLQHPNLDIDAYRRIAGNWLTGVAVVTSRIAARSPAGLTTNEVCPLSLTPPMFLVCMDLRSETLGAIEASRAFAINLLGENGGDTCKSFSRKDYDEFVDVDHESGPFGSPILAVAIAHVECGLHEAHIADDHKILVDKAAAGAPSGGEPLAYFGARFHRLAS